MSTSKLQLLTAEVVYTGIGTPLADGAVVIEQDGDRHTVVDVLPAEEGRRIWPEATETAAGFAISPRPVNAHTHLDLTDMPLVNDAYERFIPTVIAFAGAGNRTLAAAERGVEEVLDSGVTMVGDIVTRRDVLRYLLEHEQLTGVAYWEVIGMDPALTARQLAETRELIEEFLPLQRQAGGRLGPRPHTPPHGQRRAADRPRPAGPGLLIAAADARGGERAGETGVSARYGLPCGRASQHRPGLAATGRTAAAAPRTARSAAGPAHPGAYGQRHRGGDPPGAASRLPGGALPPLQRPAVLRPLPVGAVRTSRRRGRGRDRVPRR